MRTLLKHKWLSVRRSGAFERELAMTLMVGVMFIFALIMLVAMAFAIPKIIYEIPGVDNPVAWVMKMLCYYLIGELCLRYIFQVIPSIDIQPYILLPIMKARLAGFIIVRSLFSVFNVLVLILILPFVTQVLVADYGALSGWAWLISIVALSITLHFVNMLIKKKLEKLWWFWPSVIALLVINYVASSYIAFDLLSPFSSFLHNLLAHPYLVLIPLTLMVGSGYLVFRFIQTNIYLEELVPGSASNKTLWAMELDASSSLENHLILQEIKLILRHRRTRTMLIMSLIFVGYGLFFIGRPAYAEMHGFRIFIGIFLSALFTVNYGQYFWSWYTNQLDFFFTRPLGILHWLSARYKVLMFSCIISTILAMPYIYFGWDVGLLLIACALYNIGINVPLMMRMSMWDPKGVDLSKRDILNYGGRGVAQMLMGFPLVLTPCAIYGVVALFSNYYAGLSAVALVGLVGITLKRYFLRHISGKLYHLKHAFVKNLTI